MTTKKTPEQIAREIVATWVNGETFYRVDNQLPLRTPLTTDSLNSAIATAIRQEREANSESIESKRARLNTLMQTERVAKVPPRHPGWLSNVIPVPLPEPKPQAVSDENKDGYNHTFQSETKAKTIDEAWPSEVEAHTAMAACGAKSVMDRHYFMACYEWLRKRMGA